MPANFLPVLQVLQHFVMLIQHIQEVTSVLLAHVLGAEDFHSQDGLDWPLLVSPEPWHPGSFKVVCRVEPRSQEVVREAPRLR